MEQKLRQLATSSFTISDFIKTKESETNYKNLSMSIGSLADELQKNVRTRY